MYYLLDLHFKSGLEGGRRVDNQFPPRIGETITVKNYSYGQTTRDIIFRVEKVEHDINFATGHLVFKHIIVTAKQIN